MVEEYDYLYKLIIIGDSGVGKTSIVLRFCDQVFCTPYISTIGVDFKIRKISLDEKRIKLQIWDTVLYQRFVGPTRGYYRRASGIMLVYDVTDERSFQNIKTWIRHTVECAPEYVERILIGNKCDLNDKRVVEKERGEALAQEYGLVFFETSAKDDINIDEAFETFVRIIKQRRDVNPIPELDTIQVRPASTPYRSRCSC